MSRQNDSNECYIIGFGEEITISCKICLTLRPQNKLSSAKFLFYFNFKSASMLLKSGENDVWLSNSLDLGEMPSYLASHPDPSCLLMELSGGLKGFTEPYAMWPWWNSCKIIYNVLDTGKYLNAVHFKQILKGHTLAQT